MRRSFLTILISLALLVTTNHLCFAQTNPVNQSQTIKDQIEKIGIGEDATIVRNDKREFYGTIKSIEADSFQFYEVDLKQILIISYSDAAKVKKGYGSKGKGGKRYTGHRGLITSAVLFGGLFTILIIALSKDR